MPVAHPQSVAYNSHGQSGSGWTGTGGVRGMPKTRSIISIEKAPPVVGGVDINPSGGKGRRTITSGRESINLGRATITSGGTVRKSASAGAGVVGVGVTATRVVASPLALCCILTAVLRVASVLGSCAELKRQLPHLPFRMTTSNLN